MIQKKYIVVSCDGQWVIATNSFSKAVNWVLTDDCFYVTATPDILLALSNAKWNMSVSPYEYQAWYEYAVYLARLEQARQDARYLT